ncbi:MAG: hypothetical protein ACKVKR_11580 [Pseudomonadales bacterium]
MVWKKHDYEDIPGTYVFDGKIAHESYNINKMLFTFNSEECRDEFEQEPATYCDKFGVKECVVQKDFLRMLRLGCNIYFMAKMAIPRGTSVQDAGAAFQGITTEEFQQQLQDRAEGLIEKLEKAGGYWNG